MDAAEASPKRRRTTRRWRAFTRLRAHQIDRQMRDGTRPRCPDCGQGLLPRVESRKAADVVLDAVAYDLDCDECRRFVCVVLHTARSLRLLRMRRLVAAVCTVGSGKSPSRRYTPATAS